MKTCKVCLKEVEFVYKELNTQGFKVYIDKDGRRWQGKICPTCFGDKAKLSMRKLRGKNVGEVS